MKHAFLLIVPVAVAAFALSGCSGVPTKTELALFSVHTNIVQEVTLGPTGEDGTRHWITNEVETYVYTPGPAARAVGEGAGAVVGSFAPFGALVSVLSGAVFGVWGTLRSRQARKTAGVLVQVVETARELLKNTPQGQDLDHRFKQWMIGHQSEAGVIREIMQLLQTVVDQPSAEQAAERIRGLVNAASA